MSTKRLRTAADQTQITGVYDHHAGYLHLPTLMLAARNLLELVPVLLEASEIGALLRWRRLDFFKRATCQQPRALRYPA
jgi:hypothetical protein